MSYLRYFPLGTPAVSEVSAWKETSVEPGPADSLPSDWVISNMTRGQCPGESPHGSLQMGKTHEWIVISLPLDAILHSGSSLKLELRLWRCLEQLSSFTVPWILTTWGLLHMRLCERYPGKWVCQKLVIIKCGSVFAPGISRSCI